MPLFDFKCNKCGHIFDVLIRSQKDVDKEVQCPKCNSTDTKKMVSNINHKFNCGAFAEDYICRGNG